MTTCFVIGFLATQASGAAGSPTEPLALSPQTRELTASPRAAPEKCSVYKAVRHYRSRLNFWAQKMGAGHTGRVRPGLACPHYLAHVLQRKAAQARKAYLRWSYEWEWQKWLPQMWKDIIQCETHSNFQHSNSSYEGAFGFALSSWDGYKLPGYPRRAYMATPRQQYNVALAIVRGTGGTSGWGCA